MGTDMSETVWVCYFDYGYDGYSDPERVFATKELAEAWRATQVLPIDVEIKEMPVLRASE